MLVIGLTGSIGMGKSTAAKRFAARGMPVFDADAAVHRLYEGAAVEAIEAAFPGTASAGRVDRRRLSRAVVGDPAAMARLEQIVHPMVRAAEREFIARHAAEGTRAVVLEVPLLFETGLDQWVDATIVVTAPPALQRRRVLARSGMSARKLDRLLDQQMPDADKRARADFVIDTSGPIEATARAIDRIVESLQTRPSGAVDRWLGPPAAGRLDSNL